MVYVPDSDIDHLIVEDAGFGDLTTTALGIGSEAGVMRFAARHAMVACATEEACRLLTRVGARVELVTCSGELAEPGTPLLTAHGRPPACMPAGKQRRHWWNGPPASPPAYARSSTLHGPSGTISS